MMMNRFLLCVVLLFCCSSASEKLPESYALQWSDAKINEMILFLEDSQKVAEFTRQLKMLDSMRTGPVGKNIEPAKGVGVIKPRFGRAMSAIPMLVSNETGMIRSRFQFTREWMLTSNVSVKMTLVKSIALSVIAMLLCMALLMAVGKKLLVTYKRRGNRPRVAGIAALFITSGAVALSMTFALLILTKLPGTGTIHTFLSGIWQLLLSYVMVRTLVTLVFTPYNTSLRMIQCDDKVALRVYRGLVRILHVVLYVGMVSLLLRNMHITAISRLIIEAVMIGFTIHVPFLVYSIYQLHIKQSHVNEQTAHQGNSTERLAKPWLHWIHVPLFIMMSAITVITLWADDRTFHMILHAYVRSLLVIFVGGFHLLLWKRFLEKRLPVQHCAAHVYNNPALHLLDGNRRIIAIAGYTIIIAVIASVFVKTWDIHLFALLLKGNPVFGKVLRILLIATGAWIAIQAAFFILTQLQRTAKEHIRTSQKDSVEFDKRLSTLSGIFHKIVVTSVLVIGVIMVLDELGYDVKAMIAGIGIVGIAVGFGAQNLVRDIISGLFIIFENRIRVGDVAIINGTGGKVEQVNLRTIVLRSEDGTIHVFPNGAITTLSNMTHEFSYYVFSIGVAYKEDVDKVENELEAIGAEIAASDAFRDKILEPLEMMGLDRFDESAVIIKARIKTVPLEQWNVGREMNKRIKKRFDEIGIEIPYPHCKVIIDNKN